MMKGCTHSKRAVAGFLRWCYCLIVLHISVSIFAYWFDATCLPSPHYNQVSWFLVPFRLDYLKSIFDFISGCLVQNSQFLFIKLFSMFLFFREVDDLRVGGSTSVKFSQFTFVHSLFKVFYRTPLAKKQCVYFIYLLIR